MLLTLALAMSVWGSGAAEAGGALTAKKIKKIAAKVADQRIAQGSSLSVAHAAKADTALKADTATRADTAAHAASADTADEAAFAGSAGDADSVDGNIVTSFSRQMAAGATEVTLALMGPVALKLDCDSGLPNVTVTSTPGQLHYYFVSRLSGDVITDEGGSATFTSGSVNSLGIPPNGSGNLNYVDSSGNALSISYSWRSAGSSCSAFGTGVRATTGAFRPSPPLDHQEETS